MSSSDLPPAGTGLPSADRSPDGPDSPFRDGRGARDEAPQFVLPLVVRLEKSAPPGRTDALETAARAVLSLLSDPRSLGTGPDEGEWARAVRDWQDARIRKVVRRARGAEWRRAQELPGITLAGKSAEVRVYPPVPVDAWPKDLAKLQVSGTELEDAEEPAAPGPDAPVIWMNPGVPMSAGKSMAQAGHAAQLAWWELGGEERAAWRAAGFPLAVRVAEPERWNALAGSGLPVVTDAGFTEVAPNSRTALADLPVLRRRLGLPRS
ncbi:peptidyl-tRNA hydrolase [Streptomyces sp. NPDC007088]|uniref:peptidyl-tRNA hydrolase n=1 Tax=Streptomyces sp. NPDC007088 TaxID=3364773 RepID=UPI003697BA9D